MAEGKGQHRITRNVSHFKRIPNVNEMEFSSDDDECDKEPERECDYRRSNRTRIAPVRCGHRYY